MKAFEYAAPATVDEAVKLLGTQGAAALSGGTDLISRMKDYVSSPERVVYLKDIKELAGISGDAKASGLTIGAGTRLSDIVANAGIREAYPALWQATRRSRLAPDPQHGHGGRQPAPASAVLVFPRRSWPARHEGRQEPGARRRQSLPCDLHDRRRCALRQPVEPGGRPVRTRRPGDRSRAPKATAPSRSKSCTRFPRVRMTVSSRSGPGRSSPR